MCVTQANTSSVQRLDRLMFEQRALIEERPRLFPFMSKKSTDDAVVTTQDTTKTADLKIPEPEPLRPSNGYVRFETYYRDMLDMQKRVSNLENERDKMIAALEGSQKLSADNRQYTLNLWNMILTFMGTGGVAIIGLIINANRKRQH